MKTFRTLCLAALAALALAVPAQAQPSGRNWALAMPGNLAATTGSTFSPFSTNAVVQRCEEFDDVGVTWNFTGVPATTNGTVILRLAKSYDGGNTFETNYANVYRLIVTTPTWGFNTNWGFQYCTNLNLPGVTHVAVLDETNNAAGYLTNQSLLFYLKSTKRGAKTATQ